jgi:hypothetical protein
LISGAASSSLETPLLECGIPRFRQGPTCRKIERLRHRAKTAI